VTERAFAPLPTDIDLPAVEREILARWKAADVFRRSLEQTANGPRWGFFEGPPTANGKPGTHHVEARVFKDLFPRFKTMKGHHVERRAGWDCHGLPVELAVEKELGFTKKQDIEAYGIADFNARCRESALRNVADFAAMTERMGYWVDLDNAYMTMAPSYVESVWWSLKQVFDKEGIPAQLFALEPNRPNVVARLKGNGRLRPLLIIGHSDVVNVDPAKWKFPERSLPKVGSPSVAPLGPAVGKKPLVQVCPPSFDVEKPEMFTRSTSSEPGGNGGGSGIR